MSAKRDNSHYGKAHKALLLRQISTKEYRDMISWSGQLEIHGRQLYSRRSMYSKWRFVRELKTWSC